MFAFDDIRLDDLRGRFSAKWSTYPDDVLPAFVAEMDFPLSEAVTDAVAEAVARHDLGYHPPPADVGFPETVAAWLARSFDWHPPADAVITVPDVIQGVIVAIRALTSAGDGIVVTPPTYPPLWRAPGDNARRLVDVPLLHEAGTWRLDVAGIDAAFAAGARMLLLCHPHNPTGTVHAVDDLAAVAASARRHGAIVVSDEVHGPLSFVPQRHVPAAAVSDDARAVTVTATSTSKAWNIAGLKCAVLVVEEPAFHDAIMALPRRERGGVGILGLIAMAAAAEDTTPWLAEVRRYLTATREWFPSAAAAALPGVDVELGGATYFAWMDCQGLDLPSPPFEFFFEHARVACSDGRDFGPGGETFIRMNLATSRPILTAALDRMSASLVSG